MRPAITNDPTVMTTSWTRAAQRLRAYGVQSPPPGNVRWATAAVIDLCDGARPVRTCR
jgi:hypothetical protein